MEKAAEKVKKVDGIIKCLKDLEQKYPFFGFRTPTLIFGDEELSSEILFNLYLRASASERDFFSVGFRFPHNYIGIGISDRTEFVRCEAQEQMNCSGKGYNAIREFFSKYGEIGDLANSYKIKSENDLLIFDDHDNKHSSFRGWTGGYDPEYGDRSSGVSKLALSSVLWHATNEFKNLETRINTLKHLFDGLNEIAKFNVENIEKWGREEIDYFSEYEKAVNSDLYKKLLNIQEKIKKKFNQDLEKSIFIYSADPIYHFIGKDAMILVDDISAPNNQYAAEIHVPFAEEYSKIEGINVYNNNNREKCMFLVEYVDFKDKIILALEKIAGKFNLV